MTESLAVELDELLQPGESGRPLATLSGGVGGADQSFTESGWPPAPMLTALEGVCVLETLKPVGAPPFGPGIVCVASAAMPLDITTTLLPSVVAGAIEPNPGRIEMDLKSCSGVPSARRILASSRPQV